jgi:hypothetical protein
MVSPRRVEPFAFCGKSTRHRAGKQSVAFVCTGEMAYHSKLHQNTTASKKTAEHITAFKIIKFQPVKTLRHFRTARPTDA